MSRNGHEFGSRFVRSDPHSAPTSVVEIATDAGGFDGRNPVAGAIDAKTAVC